MTGPLTVSLRANYTNVPVGYPVSFTALIEGRTTESVWDFGDGDVAINQPYVTHGWPKVGDYLVALWAFNESQFSGVSATFTVHVVAQPVLHVASASTNPRPPYATWATAAKSIQQAVDAVVLPGSLVLVTDGMYPGGLSVTNPLMLRSLNGPQFTLINGGGVNECVSLTDGASLTGFTLTNGWGGVSCTSTNACLSNCVVVGNIGGGASGGTLYNCTLAGNSADGGYGGGAYSCTLYNCTLTGNSALTDKYGNPGYGGGAYGCTLCNCIVYFNLASDGANYDSSSILNYCCTRPLPTNGVGNIALNPQLASAICLTADSPCRGAGSAAYATGTDIEGEPWGNPPSIGCYEYHAGGVTGPLAVSLRADYTNVPAGYAVSFTAWIEGRTTASMWDFGDGVVVSNLPYASHAWVGPGAYPVVLRAYNQGLPRGASATMTIHVVAQPVAYVASAGTNPKPPYTTWATAARNIQQAVDAVGPGFEIVVTNGVYAGGLEVSKPLTLRSVNGPQFTEINGKGTNPCVSLADGASLSGFTLTNGSGGASCTTTDAFLTNCVMTGNSGFGANGGTLYNCTLSGNSGSGASSCTLYNCTLSSNSPASGVVSFGGGASDSTLYNCTLTGNSADDNGGGAFSCTLYNCTLAGNWTSSGYGYGGGGGGGASWCTLYNCTLTGNSAPGRWGGGADGCFLCNCTLTGNFAPNGQGGGADSSILYNCTVTGNFGGGVSADWRGNPSTLCNCTVYFNTASGGANYDTNSILNYCCTTPQPTNGVGNITEAPQFADYANGNLRLQSNSPCINAGNNAYVTGTTDLDGNPRIVSGTVDIGAYEYQGAGSIISYAWLQQYGLPADGSADFTDPDHDGMNNWQEWRCGTDPTNAASVLRMVISTPAGNNVNVTWQSVAGVTYVLQCSTNLAGAPPFLSVATNVAGQAGTTTFTHTNAAEAKAAFYRVGVQ